MVTGISRGGLRSYVRIAEMINWNIACLPPAWLVGREEKC